MTTGPRTSEAGAPRPVRFWEIDALRGVAILMMVIYHLVWDLAYFGIAEVDPYRGFWRLFARATATLFLLLVGVAIQLRAERPAVEGEAGALLRRQVRRGLTVFAAGLAVTAATWLFIPQGVVVFGILHLIGASMLLAYPFRGLGGRNLLVAAVLIAAGVWLQGVVVDFPWLVWLGLMPAGFASVDYFPLLPWFGVVLVGLFIGGAAYRGYARRFALTLAGTEPPLRLLIWLGRRSLPIYLLHQPLLIAALVLVGLIDPRALTG